MRKIVILFLAAVLLTSCNNSDRKKNKNENSQTEQEDSNKTVNRIPGNDDRNKNDTTTFRWMKREQKKFMEDCQKESAGKGNPEKLKDFCSCLLTEAQKYYPTYREMDKKANEDYESRIFLNCIGKYPEDEEKDD